MHNVVDTRTGRNVNKRELSLLEAHALCMTRRDRVAMADRASFQVRAA